MGRPKKIKVVEEVKEEVQEVFVPSSAPQVTSRPTDGTVNDRIAPVLPSLNDPGQS